MLRALPQCERRIPMNELHRERRERIAPQSKARTLLPPSNTSLPYTIDAAYP